MFSKRIARDKTTPFPSRVQEYWQLMQHGIKIIKLGSRGKRLSRSEREKTLYLDHALESISYKPSKKKHNRFEVSSIQDIQRGENVREIFRHRSAKHSIASCISITFIDREPLNIITENPQVAKCLCEGTKTLIMNKVNLKEYEKRRKSWLRKAFQKFDKVVKQKLEVSSLVAFFETLGVTVNSSYLTTKLREFSRELNHENSDSTCLSEEEYIQLFDRVWINDEIVLLMKRFSSNGVTMNADDLEFFLTEEQGENGGVRYCEEIIKYYEPTSEGKTHKELGIDGLTLYLLSTENDIFNPSHDKVYQDMTQPLTHYFIASSHNTFLEGHQLKGVSSIEAYVDTLKLGCRCVEIDCWDGDDNEPVVYHGHTLTSKILFRDIISAVRDHAFDVTPYPLILSLQVRCSVEAQIKMAHYMKEILGDKLYQDSVDTQLKAFPSPEFFKYKILVKNKKLKAEVEKADDNHEDDVSDSDDEEDGHQKQKTFPNTIRTTISNSSLTHEGSPKSTKSTTSSEEELSQIARSKTNSPKTTKKLKIAKELSKQVNYTTAVHFKNFEHSKENAKFHEMSSFNEYKAMDLIEKSRSAREFILYNMRQLSRIYPGFLRVDSSNYDPVPLWNVGCQIVALNYQSEGRDIHLNHGRFRQNGRAGYVLKPRVLRDSAIKYNLNKTKEIFGVDCKTLKLTIISGQQLSREASRANVLRDEPDPYVKVEICGIPVDCFSYCTKTISNNGLNPVWNESFEKVLMVPELAMIRFVVNDDDFGFDDFIGQNSVPFTSLRPGYRRVTLLRDGVTPVAGATLLVHVEISDGFKRRSNTKKNPVLGCFS